MWPILAILIASIIWGANSPIMKWTLTSVPLFSLAFIRFFLATLFITPFVIKSASPAGRFAKIKKEDWQAITLAALLGITLNVSLFFLGLKFTYAVNAAFIIATIPIFTVVAAGFFLREKLTGKLVLATILALAGLLLILGPPILTLGPSHLLGGFLLILSALTWVGYEIVSKKLFKSYSAAVVTFYSFLIGSATFLPLAIFEFFRDPNWVLNLTTSSYVGIFYGAVFSSTAAYFAWQYGLSKIPASQASFFFYLEPITGVIVSVLLLGEQITPFFLLGAILISFGVFWAEHKRKSHPLYHKKDQISS